MNDLSRQLSPLLRPLKVGDFELKNRVVMSPMTREYSPGGIPGEDVAGYYRRRAEAGVGLIITEGVGIAHEAAVDRSSVPLLHGEAALAGWKIVVDHVHAAGGKIIPQLWHQGVLRDPVGSPRPEVAGVRPSGIWGPRDGAVSLDGDVVARLLPETQPMSDSEIQDVIDAYALSARNAMSIGFDGIAIHAAHGYLIDTFMWHLTNKRIDRFGGIDPRARATFAVEVVRSIRRAVGDAKPIFFRFSQFKMQDYRARLANSPEELGKLLIPIAEAGVDVFDGSQRYFDTPVFDGSELNLGGWAKKLTGKLAMAVGGVGLDKGQRVHHVNAGAAPANNLGRLVERLSKEEFDLIGIGRSLLNDPRWFERAVSGEYFLPFDDCNLSRLT